ncbi:MAG: molybdopterin-guanine dinucleotide biosynthesis protein MobB, partial [Planctomycetes bacterium]|nr:molybdopterin-guanine dinucleotide biosynthesis protein MobB [Planctomycetota bacterium]
MIGKREVRNMGKTPVIYVYGISDSGKTRLVERLLLELIQKGHRVGTVKLSKSDALALDPEGKDTDRHLKAGSMVTAATSRSNSAVFMPKPQGLDRLVEMMTVTGQLDLVIVEGLGVDPPDNTPKIAVGEVKGIATGTVMELPGPDAEIGSLLHIIDRIMVKREETVSVELKIGGRDVHLKPFVQNYLEGTLRGAVGSLKDPGDTGDEIELRLP